MFTSTPRAAWPTAHHTRWSWGFQNCLQEKKQLLSFVVVGGGPTGVEVAAELQDMVESDLVKVYPDLVRDVRIAVIELQDHVLSTYDRRISEYTRQIFTRWPTSTSTHLDSSM